MFLKTLARGPDRNLSYLFGPEGNGPLAAVDPGSDPQPVLDAAGGRPIAYIFATHGHADHIEGLLPLKQRTNGLVLAHRLALPAFEAAGIPLDIPLSGGDHMDVGGVPLRILYTPGHHPAAISILVADRYLFTGDTLFVGDCGRTDLAEASAFTLFVTVRMLAQLEDDVIILPGHDYGPTPTSTIGRERAENPAMTARTFEEFDAIP